MTHHTEAELLRDIEEHMRKMWNERLLPASCWPTELAQRLTQAVRRAPAAPAISEEQVLAITTAYEQGVGKGHQSHARKEAIKNPYCDYWRCDSAWQMGYDEGREQAERKAAAPQPPEATSEGSSEVGNLIESREIVSNPGCGVTVTRLNLSEAGRAALQSKANHIADAAPQPPEVSCSVSNGETEKDPRAFQTHVAAPVQMPEPSGCLVYANGESHHWDANKECAELFVDREKRLGAPYIFAFENLYTEQQVRQLLADNGIGKDKA